MFWENLADNLSMTDGNGLNNHKASVTPMADHDENENATPKNVKNLWFLIMENFVMELLG